MNEVDEETPINGGGLGMLLIPGAVIAAILGAVIFFMNSGKTEAKKAESEPVEVAEVAKGKRGRRGMIELAPASINAPISVKTIQDGLTEIIDDLLTNLDGVKDSESAERALPGLKEIVTKIEAMGHGLNTLSSKERTKVDELLLTQIEKLSPVIDRIKALPEIGDAIQPLLEKAKQKLISYTD